MVSLLPISVKILKARWPMIHRLTRLLAQCVGKARDAIKSCVNLPVGQRYNAAWKTLLKNFGQPHMVAGAHMRKLKEYNLKRVDATDLMDFARRL